MEINNIITNGFTLILMTSNQFFLNVLNFSVSSSAATGAVGTQPRNGRMNTESHEK